MRGILRSTTGFTTSVTPLGSHAGFTTSVTPLGSHAGFTTSVTPLGSREGFTTSVTPLGSRVDDASPGPLLDADSPCRELAYRSNDGIEVTLSWQSATDELVVCVCDHQDGAYFEIRPARHLALEVFNHPYSYIASPSA